MREKDMLVPKITSSVNKDFLISCTKIVVTKTQLGLGHPRAGAHMPIVPS